MESSKKCKMMECCRTHRCGVIGMILIVIATVLTIMTLNGLGILGMFLVGMGMCCHKRLFCHCKNCETPYDDEVMACDVVVKETKRSTKKSAS